MSAELTSKYRCRFPEKIKTEAIRMYVDDSTRGCLRKTSMGDGGFQRKWPAFCTQGCLSCYWECFAVGLFRLALLLGKAVDSRTLFRPRARLSGVRRPYSGPVEWRTYCTGLKMLFMVVAEGKCASV